MEGLPRSLKVFFFYNIDVKVTVNPLLNDFKRKSIVFLLFSSLSSYIRISTRSIYYFLNLFFFKNRLCKVDILEPVLEVAEFLSFPFTIVIFVNYYDDLEKYKNIILMLVNILNFII